MPYCLKQFVIYIYIYIYYYKETLEKVLKIPIDKWITRWYHIINERERTTKKNFKKVLDKLTNKW